MGIINTSFRTVSCNSCDKTATFPTTDQVAANKAMEDFPWLKTTRLVNSADGRSFAYCSDECEVAGVTSGQHNPPEPKKIIEAPNEGTQAAIALAAQAAKQAEEATKSLKAGKPTKLQVIK